MESKINSAIDMRKIQTLTDAENALNVVLGYIMGVKENPLETNRSQYLSIKRWLGHDLKLNYPQLSEKIQNCINEISMILLGLNRIHKSRVFKKRNGGSRYGK